MATPTPTTVAVAPRTAASRTASTTTPVASTAAAVPVNYDKARDACRRHLQAAGLSEEVVIELERGVFNACLAYADDHGVPREWSELSFRTLYDAKARSAVVNVDKSSNADLRASLDAGDCEPRVVPFMPPEARMPKLWKAIEERAAIRAQLIASGDALAGVVSWSERYKCSKCKQRKCKYTEVQLRSADEPMAILVKCFCGNRWRAG